MCPFLDWSMDLVFRFVPRAARSCIDTSTRRGSPETTSCVERLGRGSNQLILGTTDRIEAMS